MKKRLLWWILLLLLCVLTAAAEEAGGAEEGEGKSGRGVTAYPAVIDRWSDPQAYPDFSFAEGDDLLEIWFPRIRDRDAAILRYQDQVWMIDCSDVQAEERVVPLLRSLGITGINRIVNTHPHFDHIDGFISVDRVCPVEELLICFPEDCNENMKKVTDYCREKGIRITPFVDEEILWMGDGLVRMTCWLKVREEEGLNDRSAQIMLSCGLRTMLFMADIEGTGQDQLFAALPPERLRADILRYPHHGKHAMRDRLYDAIDPALVVVTTTENALSARESTQFLTYRHVPRVYTTRGYLHLVTDGVTWLAERVPDAVLFNKENGIPAPVMTGETRDD